MLSTLFKKKLSSEQIANVFVNGVLKVVDKGFCEVKSLIEEDSAFLQPPQLENASDGHFIMIIIVGNVKYFQDSFLPEEQKAIEPLIFEKFSHAFGMEESTFKDYFKSYSSFMSRVNHPSRVVLYSMSKAMFFKYKLNACQDDYFRKMDTPNPLFIKRMDDIMKNFIWDWQTFSKRFKISHH